MYFSNIIQSELYNFIIRPWMFFQKHFYRFLYIEVRIHVMVFDKVFGNWVYIPILLEIIQVFFSGVAMPKLIADRFFQYFLGNGTNKCSGYFLWWFLDTLLFH